VARRTTGPPKHPGVKVQPPMLFVAGIVAAWLLGMLVPLRIVPDRAHDGATIGGTVLLVLGMGIVFWGAATFFRARTAIIPHYPASRIVSHGPYRFTRNPMYLGMTLAYVGFALILNWAWPLLLLPLVLWSLIALVIRREERYLSQAFGEEYLAYRSRVRRWI
jgi:protein-S-isoprenylcysteine O-methyltransferase Ste14